MVAVSDRAGVIQGDIGVTRDAAESHGLARFSRVEGIGARFDMSAGTTVQDCPCCGLCRQCENKRMGAWAFGRVGCMRRRGLNVSIRVEYTVDHVVVDQAQLCRCLTWTDHTHASRGQLAEMERHVHTRGSDVEQWLQVSVAVYVYIVAGARVRCASKHGSQGANSDS